MSKEIPYFSFVIPTLNEELFLPKLLQSLSKQKADNFEVIIIDGFSEDRTKSAAQEYAKKMPITFMQHKARNVSIQKNFGANLAKGKYIIFLDADNMLPPLYTKKAESIIEKKKGLVFNPYYQLYEKKEFQEMQLVVPLWNRFVELSQNTAKPFSIGAGMIWERNFYLLIGGFDEKAPFAEDHELIRAAHAWGVKAKTLPNLYMIVSIRRMKKEGRLPLYYKYITAHWHLLFKEKIDKAMFTYEMGGKGYDKLIKDYNKGDLSEEAKKFFEKLKQLFNS